MVVIPMCVVADVLRNSRYGGQFNTATARVTLSSKVHPCLSHCASRSRGNRTREFTHFPDAMPPPISTNELLKTGASDH